MSYRIVKKIVTGRQAIDGAGVHLVRVLGSGTIRDFDPFLMLDAFDSLESWRITCAAFRCTRIAGLRRLHIW